MIEEEENKSTDTSELAADIFASELLMPESDIKVEYDRIVRTNRLSYPEEVVELDSILQNEHEIYSLTLKLGYEEQLSEAAIAIMNKIRSKLGSERNGQK